MTNEKIAKILEINRDVCFNQEREFNQAYYKAIQIVKQLASLESEYHAYGNTYDDYWRGVEHSINVLEYKE